MRTPNNGRLKTTLLLAFILAQFLAGIVMLVLDHYQMLPPWFNSVIGSMR